MIIGVMTGFKSFLQDQYNNLERGWTLSDKQEAAVTKAVKRYAVYFFKKNDPEYKQKIDDKIARINVIKKLLFNVIITRVIAFRGVSK